MAPRETPPPGDGAVVNAAVAFHVTSVALLLLRLMWKLWEQVLKKEEEEETKKCVSLSLLQPHSSDNNRITNPTAVAVNSSRDHKSLTLMSATVFRLPSVRRFLQQGAKVDLSRLFFLQYMGGK